MRNFGIVSDRPASSGATTPAGRSSLRADTPRDLNHSATRAPSRRVWSNLEGSNLPLLDSGSAPLKFGHFSQTLIDIATLIFCALFVCVTGVGIAFAAFILFFVNTQ